MAEDSKDNIDPSFCVLNPDNPLLEKFQQALKEHLLKQIAHIKDEVFEIETEIEQKNAEIQVVGIQTYEVQQKVQKQHKYLEDLIQTVETTTAANEEELNELEKNKKELKNIENQLFQSEKANRDLRKEIESMTLLNKQLALTEDKVEKTISVNKRKAEKTRLDNEKLAKEKRRQDYMIHTLHQEIWKIESDFETLKMQFRMKQKEMEEIQEKVIIGNASTFALQTEYKCLMHSWNSVVVAIGNRDKGLECLQQELKTQQEKYKSMVTEIEQVHKLTKKEFARNESLTYTKKRILGEIKSVKSDLDKQLEKRDELETKVLELQNILETTEKDLKIVHDEIIHKKNAYDYIIKSYNSYQLRKGTLEEQILKILQSEIITNHITEKLKAQLNSMKQKRVEMEIMRTEVENKRSLFTAEAACQKNKNEELWQVHKDLQEQFEVLEKEQKELALSKDRLEFQFRKKEKLVQDLNNQLDVIKQKRTGEQKTKEELRTKEMESCIEELEQSVKRLQILWLREQNNLLAVSNERQDQIQNVDLMKKQVLLLEVKNVRISDEIDDINKRKEKVQHNINILTNRATILCNTVFTKRNKKNDLDRANILLQTDYEAKLKQSEIDFLIIEDDIAGIEKDKVVLSQELIDVNREVLEWEKTYLLAKESCMTMKEIRGKTGEIPCMKLEIHKMGVIYGQLKKAQDKLLKDMEYCISRRDNIFYTSEAIQKKQRGKDPVETIKINLTKKLDNLKNQIKQAENDIAGHKRRIKHIEDKHQNTTKIISEYRDKQSRSTTFINHLKQELEETKINRELKFELLVMSQRRAFMYKQIIKNCTPYTIYKKQEDLVYEYKKAKSINGKLLTINRCLSTDFPNMKMLFNKIENTLGLVALCIYI